MEDVKKMLDEAIAARFADIADAEGEAKSIAISDLVKLYTMKVDEVKAEFELEDATLKRQQEERSKYERYIKYGLEGAGIVLPLIFYGIWMNKGLKFEEEGVLTSSTFRGLIQKFKPTK